MFRFLIGLLDTPGLGLQLPSSQQDPRIASPESIPFVMLKSIGWG
jgi:hypothetical protein